MNREQILRSRLEMARHNLRCYSATWAMETPKEGCEDKFFEVDTGAGYTRGDRRNLQLGHEVQGWFIGEDGSCWGKYDMEKDHRDSRLMKVTVDNINYIRRIEWLVNEEA